jgi:tetratricopeptide (TPR) repeat protein
VGRGRSAFWSDAALLAVAPLLALAVFAAALAGGFVHDDHRQIVGNPLVQSLSHLRALFTSGVWAGAGSGSSWYRPLMMSSFALDRALFGPGALGFHAVQLALFAIVAALAVRSMTRFGAPASVALLAGALGAVHPAQAEVAAWISARCDSLLAAAALAALLLYDRALAATSARARGLLQIGVGVAFFATLCSKESAVAIAPLFVCVDRVRGARFAPRELAARHAAWLLALAVYLALRAHSLGGVSGGLLAPMDPLAILGAFGQAAARIVAPVALTISPPLPTPWHAAFGALASIGALGAFALAWRRRSPLLVPIALAAAPLAIAALGAARIGEMADRYLVLPIFATAWLVAAGIASLPAPLRVAGFAAGAAAVATFAVAAATHVRVYASDESLWTDAWAKNPHSLRAAANLGALHLDRNEPYRAIEWLDRAAALAPGDAEIEMNRAVASEQQGDARSARQRLEALLASQPFYWPAAVRAGHLALAAEDWNAAGEHYEAALRVHPLAAEAWAGLGVAREKQGRKDDARHALSRALALDPQVQNADALRRLLERLG